MLINITLITRFMGKTRIKKNISALTVEQLGLIDLAEEMVAILGDLKNKDDNPRGPNWHDVDESEALDYLSGAGFVNSMGVAGCYGTVSYCITKKGRQLYESLQLKS